MSSNTTSIKVDTADAKRLSSRFKDEYIELHPEFDGMILSRRVLFKKLLDYVLKEGEFYGK